MNHLKAAPRPIRQLVITNGVDSDDGSPTSLSTAYDAAVLALKGLRDTHIRIATLYIVSQMPRKDVSVTALPSASIAESSAVAKGTGGSDLVPFLKGSRDDTTNMMLNRSTKSKREAEAVP
jgi:indoleamine 2,3-dioxygenase